MAMENFWIFVCGNLKYPEMDIQLKVSNTLYDLFVHLLFEI